MNIKHTHKKNCLNSPETKKKFAHLLPEQEEEEEQEEQETKMDSRNGPLCIKGCGFYGSEDCNNMCSKCYRDYLKTQLIAKTRDDLDKSSPPQPLTDAAAMVDSCHHETAAPGSSSRRRCECCNKKVGLMMEFKCRCGNVYCKKHRHPQEHACTFDFKSFDRQILIKDNPLIKSEKLIDRI